MNDKIKIIIPLPNNDFDPSEVAIPWKLLTSAGYTVLFATPDGKIAKTDPMMISGEGLDFWGWLPLIKKFRLIGLLLRANKNARAAYKQLIQDSNFQTPCSYQELSCSNYQGLVLPGGHAQGIKVYLEDKILQSFVVNFFEQPIKEANNESSDELSNKVMTSNTSAITDHKPIMAVCHGVLVACRAISPITNKSVLYGKKTTALTWALESSAWKLTKYFARFWDANYYRTYMESPNEPVAYWSVEQEVKRALAQPSDFLDVPKNIPYFQHKTSGVLRDSLSNDKPAWVVEDGNYLSSRWPGDIHTMTLQFIEKLKQLY